MLPVTRKKRTLRYLWYTLIAVAALYALYCFGVYKLQRRFIFLDAYSHPALPERKPPGDGEDVWLEMPDGARVEAWYFRGAGVSAETPGPAVVFLHGSEKLLDNWEPQERPYVALGVSVLVPEYRGYGRSSGKPGQPEITADLRRFRAWLTARPEVDATRIVYHGRSLGGGVAAALAREEPPAALILEGTFTSMASFASRLLVPQAICRHPYRTDEFLAAWDGPTLIFHGSRDDVISVEHGRTLARVARHAKYFELPDTHYTLPSDHAAYWRYITEFLREQKIISAAP